MIYTTGGNFYLPAEALAASPSRADGIDAPTEAELRRYCCDVVAESVVLLRLPQVVAVTGQVLVQRFYCKRSLKKFDVKHVAMAAIWLACKLEEVIEIDNPQRLTLRTVITVTDRVIRRRDGRSLSIMDPYSQRYEEMKQQAVKTERHMLRAFGFVLHMEHPHRFVLNYCTMLACSNELQQEAWNMANDSLRTTLCVRYRAEVVACGILFTAARKLKEPLPENPPWWRLFEVRETEVYDVAATLCDLYTQARATHAPLQRPAPGAELPPSGARSPLSAQGTPLRSPIPSAAPSTVGSLAALPVASADAPCSEGRAPSVAQQAASSDKQQQASGGVGEAPAGEANGRTEKEAGLTSGGRKSRPDDSGKDVAKERQRSPSHSRDDSRSRRHSRSPERKRRSRSEDRSRSRERRRSRSRERKRERREDRPLYRPGAGRPPRLDERRREGTHRHAHTWPCLARVEAEA